MANYYEVAVLRISANCSGREGRGWGGEGTTESDMARYSRAQNSGAQLEVWELNACQLVCIRFIFRDRMYWCHVGQHLPIHIREHSISSVGRKAKLLQ